MPTSLAATFRKMVADAVGDRFSNACSKSWGSYRREVIASDFDVDALLWAARRLDPSRALCGVWQTPDWHPGRDALEAQFALDRTTHFLRHHRGLWPQVWERQITRALQAMLAGQPDRRLARCQALLDALEGPQAPRLVSVARVTADGADRMDLAIHGRSSDGLDMCLVVEAKLDSELSDTQLSKYRRGLLRDYPDADQRSLWVVATRLTERTRRVLGRNADSEWRFASWRRLLVEWQRALPEDAGVDALSLFAEIWKRVGGS